MLGIVFCQRPTVVLQMITKTGEMQHAVQQWSI